MARQQIRAQRSKSATRHHPVPSREATPAGVRLLMTISHLQYWIRVLPTAFYPHETAECTSGPGDFKDRQKHQPKSWTQDAEIRASKQRHCTVTNKGLCDESLNVLVRKLMLKVLRFMKSLERTFGWQ